MIKHFQDYVLSFLKKQMFVREVFTYTLYFFFFLMHLCVQDSSLSSLVISLDDVKTKTEITAEFGQIQYDSHLLWLLCFDSAPVQICLL